jgi:hypothetical protein
MTEEEIERLHQEMMKEYIEENSKTECKKEEEEFIDLLTKKKPLVYYQKKWVVVEQNRTTIHFYDTEQEAMTHFDILYKDYWKQKVECKWCKVWVTNPHKHVKSIKHQKKIEEWKEDWKERELDEYYEEYYL